MIEVHIHVQPLESQSLPRQDLVTVLRWQLILLRVRAKQGIPVSVESLARAERVACELEAEELAV